MAAPVEVSHPALLDGAFQLLGYPERYVERSGLVPIVPSTYDGAIKPHRRVRRPDPYGIGDKSMLGCPASSMGAIAVAAAVDPLLRAPVR